MTLARGVGGSFGAAVFGTIFSSRLRSALHDVLGGPLGALVAGGARLTGAQVASLPGEAKLAYENAYVHALQPVFLVAAAIAAVGFLLSLRLREQPLRATASTSGGLGDALAAPKSPDSLAEIDRALGMLVGAERRREMAHRQEIDQQRIDAVELELRERGLTAEGPGGVLLTPAGVALADQVLSGRREELGELLADHDAHRQPEVQQLLEQLCVELSGTRP